MRGIRAGLRPAGDLRLHTQHHRCAGFCVGLLFKCKQNRARIFDGAPPPKPDVKRNAANKPRREIAEINGDEAESAALKQQIRGAQGLLEFTAANPKQAGQPHAGGLRRSGIEGVAAINKGTKFRGASARSEDGGKRAAFARADSAENFRKRSARQTLRERVKGRDARRGGLGKLLPAILERSGNAPRKG